ncbi:MAG: hypothetical protein F9K43_01035 [Bauldia sp.]|nr:MAG: hypothetical protein F9K43_01035 [Bauldia sp.]MBZ0228239.1 hypothetical protein [Bauldia sp.]
MFERDEVIRSLTGAWWLFLDRPGAMRFFDVTLDGFWRSFAAVFLLVPAFALTATAEYQVVLSDAIPDDGFSNAAFVFDKILALGLDWIALPIILAILARPLGIARTYAAFIVARNWCSVIAVLPFGLIGLLFASGIFGIDAANFLSLAALIVILRYNYLIARRALNAGIAFAIGLVVLDLVVSLSIAAVADSLAGI